MSNFLALTLSSTFVTLSLSSTTDLRRDGVSVIKPIHGHVQKEFESILRDSYPFKPFSDAYVKTAKATPTNWTALGLVTPVKDQGPHGYCGTFGRVGAAEGQYVKQGGGPLTSFSEEELVDCIGWDLDQFAYFTEKGFMTTADYPYNETAYPDQDPPIPGNPCKYDAAKVVSKTSGGAFTNSTGAAPTEDQLVAFVHHNGPTQTGIASDVFAMRAKGCEATGDCWITHADCNAFGNKDIDHSIILVGYGTDPVQGDYWIVKNSWSTAFANGGFINVARGVNCANIACCGNTFTYGDPSKYYQ
jgi:cathepsin L